VCGKNASSVEPYIPLICGSNYGPHYTQVLKLNDRLTNCMLFASVYSSSNRYFQVNTTLRLWLIGLCAVDE